MLDMAFTILEYLYQLNPALFTVIALGFPVWLRRGRTGGSFDDVGK